MSVFSKSRSKEDASMQKELSYRHNFRQLESGIAQLARLESAKRRSAVAFEKAGKHELALCEARSMRYIASVKERLEFMKGRLEMLHSVSMVGGAIESFSALSAQLADSLPTMLSPEALAGTALGMERGELAIQDLMDRIDAAMPIEDIGAPNIFAHDPEAEAGLSRILADASGSDNRRIIDLTNSVLDNAARDER